MVAGCSILNPKKGLVGFDHFCLHTHPSPNDKKDHQSLKKSEMAYWNHNKNIISTKICSPYRVWCRNSSSGPAVEPHRVLTSRVPLSVNFVTMMETDEWKLGNTKAAPCDLVSVPRRIEIHGDLHTWFRLQDEVDLWSVVRKKGEKGKCFEERG